MFKKSLTDLLPAFLHSKTKSLLHVLFTYIYKRSYHKERGRVHVLSQIISQMRRKTCLLWYTNSLPNIWSICKTSIYYKVKKTNQLQLKTTKTFAYHSSKRALTYLLCLFGHQIPLYLQWSASKEHYFPVVRKSGL